MRRPERRHCVACGWFLPMRLWPSMRSPGGSPLCGRKECARSHRHIWRVCAVARHLYRRQTAAQRRAHAEFHAWARGELL